MSRAEFQDYWLNHHGPLFKQFVDTCRAVRYVQCHTIDSSLNENIMKSRGTSEAYAGVGEVWWQSEEEFFSAINSAEGQKLMVMFVEEKQETGQSSRLVTLASDSYVGQLRRRIQPRERQDTHQE